MTTARSRARDLKKEQAVSQASGTKELWQFVMSNKKWWLAPMVLMLALLGLLLVVTQGSAVAPFIYTLF